MKFFTVVHLILFQIKTMPKKGKGKGKKSGKGKKGKKGKKG